MTGDNDERPRPRIRSDRRYRTNGEFQRRFGRRAMMGRVGSSSDRNVLERRRPRIIPWVTVRFWTHVSAWAIFRTASFGPIYRRSE